MGFEYPGMSCAFGKVELDAELFELRLAGTRVHLEPQVFDVLSYLAEHRDYLVSKAELLDGMRGNRFVSESALTSRIALPRIRTHREGRPDVCPTTLAWVPGRFRPGCMSGCR